MNTLRVDAYFSKMEKKLLFKNIQKSVDKASSLRLKGTTTILPDLIYMEVQMEILGKILYQYLTNIRNRIHNIIREKGATGFSEEKIFTTDLPI